MNRRNVMGAALVPVLFFSLLTRPGRAEEPAGPGEWRELFDGSSEAGWWNPFSWGEVEVADGEIRLTADKKFFLLTDRTYDDFVFEGEVKLPEGKSNSGFMFRAHQEPDRVWGYQAEVDPSERAWSGGLYDEGRRAWLHPDKKDEATIEAFTAKGNALDRYGWNKYVITCIGNKITIEVNGRVTTEYEDDMDKSGYLAVQHHGEDGQTYAFRNLRVKELGRAKGDWIDLFTGNELAAWTKKDGSPANAEAWVFEGDGVLHRKGSGGDLYTAQEFGNFELEFDWKVAPGSNSGVKYRVADYDGKHIGPEYQVLDDDKHPDAKKSNDRRAACLYDVVEADTADVLNPVGEWNQARVVADGSRLQHFLNGVKVAEADVASKQWKELIDDSKYQPTYGYGSQPGRILIQDHKDPVWYRNMRVRELK